MCYLVACRLPVAWAISLFLIAGAAFFAGRTTAPDNRGSILRQKGFTYISPIIGCEIAADKKDFAEFSFMQSALERSAAAAKKQHLASSVSVYFRTLNSGRWTGVNENDLYSPASMLKLATVITYYRSAELRPSLLQKEFVWAGGSQDHNNMQLIEPTEKLRAGASYSADELIRRVILYSDNNAAELLKRVLNPRDLLEVYSDLTLPLPGNVTDDFMSPKSYSLLFRVLYNATYLSRETSEHLLSLLAQTSFPDGVRKGVPKEIEIAHKFGERTIVNQQGTPVGERELHDCGIVYYPDHPYFLCVMTRGSDYTAMSLAIANISRETYATFDDFWKTQR